MITGIIAFIQFLPRLIEIVDRVGRWMEKNNMKDFLDQVEAAIDKLEGADTAEKKLDAARDIAVIIGKLG